MTYTKVCIISILSVFRITCTTATDRNNTVSVAAQQLLSYTKNTGSGI